MKTQPSEIVSAYNNLTGLVCATHDTLGALATATHEYLEPMAGPVVSVHASRQVLISSRYGTPRVRTRSVPVPPASAVIGRGMAVTGVHLEQPLSQHNVVRPATSTQPDHYSRRVTIAVHYDTAAISSYSISDGGTASICYRTTDTLPRCSSNSPEALQAVYGSGAELTSDYAQKYMLALTVGELAATCVGGVYGKKPDTSALPDLIAKWTEHYPIYGMQDIGRIAAPLFPGQRPAPRAAVTAQ